MSTNDFFGNLFRCTTFMLDSNSCFLFNIAAESYAKFDQSSAGQKLYVLENLSLCKEVIFKLGRLLPLLNYNLSVSNVKL